MPILPVRMQSRLKNFENGYCKGRNLAERTRIRYVQEITLFGRFLASKGMKDFLPAGQDTFIGYFDSIHRTEGTLASKKIVLKVFYGFLGKPRLVDWIKVKRPPIPKIEPEDIISRDEFISLLSACRTQRDRAALQVLFETGARIGEILSLKVKDAHFERNTTYIGIRVSKTEPRKLYLFDSVPDLKKLIEAHPDPKPESPLFTVRGGKQMGYFAFRGVLRLIAARAKFGKKIHPHLFRHSRASMDAKAGMPQPMAEKKYGWSKGSMMYSRYSHLSDRDVADWDMKQRGLRQEEPEQGQKAKECLRCKTMNPWTSTFCGMCGMSLDAKDAELVGEYDEITDEAMRRTLKKKGVMKEFLKEVEKVRKERK
jgi:integrase/ribosomal protein L40E